MARVEGDREGCEVGGVGCAERDDGVFTQPVGSKSKGWRWRGRGRGQGTGPLWETEWGLLAEFSVHPPGDLQSLLKRCDNIHPRGGSYRNAPRAKLGHDPNVRQQVNA